MSMPFYVSPEQMMKDKADFARKGIARGRSVIVTQYDEGILFLADNPSRALHKISEIYDRIAFAAVGKYNEFENMRVAGIRLADYQGYAYDRQDVTARALANAYAQTLGTIFTETTKPFEVEIVVAEVGRNAEEDQLYRLGFDGSVAEEHGFLVMGGQAEQLQQEIAQSWQPGQSLETLVTLIHRSLHVVNQGAAPGSTTTAHPEQFEAAVLERARLGRCFHRLTPERLSQLLED